MGRGLKNILTNQTKCATIILGVPGGGLLPLKREVVIMITYSELFLFVTMLVSIISLIIDIIKLFKDK